jgi:hypothetical protein
MPLSQKHRSSIYRTLSPLLGEEEAEAMLSQFPAHEVDELVTRGHLRAELADLRSELRTGLSDLRVDMQRGFRLQTTWLTGVLFAAVAFARFA